MRIVTSSFYKSLPPQLARISIARWAPKGRHTLPTLRELAPGEWFRDVDVHEYRRRYLDQLSQLDPHAVVRKIEDLARGGPAALLCWERTNDGKFCHRGFVSQWLWDELKLEVPEYGRELDGAGAAHPKLPDAFREPPTNRLL